MPYDHVIHRMFAIYKQIKKIVQNWQLEDDLDAQSEKKEIDSG
jgi:hypothetical protein